MPQEKLDAAYQDVTDWQSVIDDIEEFLHYWKGKVDEITTARDQWVERQSANRTLLARANKALAGPAQMGVTARARGDQQECTQNLERCADEIQQLEARLKIATNWVAQYTAKKKAFPMQKLRDQRAVADLRAKARKPRSQIE